MAAPQKNFYAALMNMRVSSSEEEEQQQQQQQQQQGGDAGGSDANAAAALADGSDGAPPAAAAAAGDKAAAADKEAAAADKEAAAAADRAKRRRLPNPLVWIDLEMTGLDVERDTIVEIACLVSDGDLKRVVEGPALAIHQPEEVLANMNDWCKEHHGKSGLTQRVRESTVSLEEAEQRVLDFVREHTEYQSAQLAGNSVHVDRAFLMRRMPRLLEHLHYRIVDVSSFAEVAR